MEFFDNDGPNSIQQKGWGNKSKYEGRNRLFANNGSHVNYLFSVLSIKFHIMQPDPFHKMKFNLVKRKEK